jgi:Glycosyl hydrolase family 30 beta sandwich domain
VPHDRERDRPGGVVVREEDLGAVGVGERDVVESGRCIVRAFENHDGDNATAGLDDVAFKNPDGSKILLAYNNSPRPIRFAVAWKG